MSRRGLGLLGLALLVSACRTTPESSAQSAWREQRRTHLESLRSALNRCSLEQRDAYDPSSEEEYLLGRTIAAHMLDELGVEPLAPTHPLAQYVDKVGQYVAMVADLRGEEATEPLRADRPEQELEDRPWPLAGYRVLVLPLAEPRATASPGGTIMISTGMLQQLRSEEELAAVLAHEVAHLRRGHGVELLKAYLCQSDLEEHVAQRGGPPPPRAERARPERPRRERPLLRERRWRERMLYRGMRLRELRDQLVLHRLWGRSTQRLARSLRGGHLEELELEADRMAVSHLATAGYDPRALKHLLQRLEHEAGGQYAWLRTHPSFQERLRTLEPRLAELPPEQLTPPAAAMDSRTRRFQESLASLQAQPPPAAAEPPATP